MDTNQKQQGTSFPILAAYYAYKLTIQRLSTGQQGEMVELQPHQAIIPSAYAKGMNQGLYFNECLPVLRPFSALTSPLPSGEVPAVEVTKRCLTEWGRNGLDWSKATAAYYELPECVKVDLGDGGTMIIFPDLRGIELAAIDYLTANHFARPINGRPLVEGVDFIPLSDATQQ